MFVKKRIVGFISLIALSLAVGLSVFFFYKKDSDKSGNYDEFLYSVNFAYNYAPAVNAWVKEQYGDIDVSILFEVLTEHCNDESVSLEVRDVSCDAISNAKNIKLYLSSDMLPHYLSQAMEECLFEENTHACSAVFNSLMLMEGVYVTTYSSIYNSFLEKFIVFNNTREHPKPYCFTELRAALQYLTFESSFKDFCGGVDRAYSNENILGYKALIGSLNYH